MEPNQLWIRSRYHMLQFGTNILKLVNCTFRSHYVVHGNVATYIYCVLTVMRENETLRNSLRQFNSGLDPGDSFNLQHFTYNNSAMLNLIIDSIANTDFLGLTVSYGLKK